LNKEFKLTEAKNSSNRFKLNKFDLSPSLLKYLKDKVIRNLKHQLLSSKKLSYSVEKSKG